MFFNKYRNKTIGILYICTGRYDIYWEQFYASAEKNFCPGITKKYFVFTDSKSIQPSENVVITYQERLGWPKDTLMRFHIFRKHIQLFKECDYLFFFNANMHFSRKLKPKHILPAPKEQLCAVIHPYYYESPIGAPFEDNPQSTAYVNAQQARHYVQGCVNGGIAAAYIEMIENLVDNIDADLQKDYIAKWHDESHLNCYLVYKVPGYKALHAGFAKPEGRQGFPFKEMILNIDKNKQGGLEFLRS